jgi:predicted short-subunit dehydrogenase-like oxidoreductase (DUF2520 family)
MQIVMIGSGNVAAVLGRKFKAAGHEIVQIISRNAKAASELAYEWDTISSNYMSAIERHADVYLVAVSDDAINDVVQDLQLKGKVVAHTAASIPKEVLKNVTDHYGVFYPLQSLRKETIHLPDVPVFVEASDEKTRQMLEKLAQSISPQHVNTISGDERTKLHVAAVLVNNFTNYCYQLAEEFCQKEGLNFAELQPLIEETALRIKTASPATLQTGPAIRHDTETINKHLALLEAYPRIRELYAFMTESIMEGKS